MESWKNGPVELNVYQTDACNLACRFCRRQRAAKAATQAPDVTAKLIDRVRAMFPTLQTACVAGFGEPTLSPQRGEVLRALGGLRTTLITNGVQWYANVAPTEAVREVSVSLNAADGDEYFENTGRGWFEHVCYGVRVLSTLCRTAVSFVVTRGSLQRIPRYVELAEQLGAHAVDLHNLLPHHHAGEDEWFLEHVLRRDDPETIAALADYHRQFGPQVRNWPQPIDPAAPGDRCQSPFVSIGVDGLGRVTPCRRVYAPSLPLWDFEDGPSVWHSPAFDHCRREVKNEDFRSRNCALCFGAWKG